MSSRRSRWLKRGLIGFLVVANLAVFAAYWRLRTLQDLVVETAVTIPGVVPELTPAGGGGEPTTFLVIGSDSRSGLDSLQNFGSVEGHRADVIMLVRTGSGGSHAQILSLPRDLWVAIPGHGENRINAAYAFGDAPLMVRTVREATGIDVNHYLEIDFVGFQALVDEIGGVTIDFPYPARDANSGLDVAAGRQVLNGTQALAFARSRHYHELQNGTWVPVAADDIGRTQRQQQLIFAILSELRRPSTLTEAGPIVQSFASHLSIDQALAESSLIEMAFQMRGISAETIEAATLPTTGATINGASVLRRDDPAAANMIAAFRQGNPLTAAADTPSTVAVLNGNGVEGSAREWSEYLHARGFDISRIGDADRKDFLETLVLVRPGQLSMGRTIVDALGFGTVDVGTVADGTDVLVVVGKDAARISAAGASGG